MGPAPRNCVQIIDASLLGEWEDSFERGFVARLDFPEGGRGSHLAMARQLLEQAGYTEPDQLRSLPGLPRGRWICRELTKETPALVPTESPLLLHAAVLGLCSSVLYCPGRPVIWTESRLRRRLVLYREKNFYED